MIIKFSEIELPSNKKFGIFFSIVFFVLAIYFFYKTLFSTGLIFLIFSISFILIAIFKPSLLLLLNKTWMRFGFLLGSIVSPIVLSILFFGLLTPISLLTKLFGRDELNLKITLSKSKWIHVNEKIIKKYNFYRQF